MSIERRRFPRIPLLAEAWLTVGDERVHVRTRDLSRGGMCVDIKAALPNQHPCDVEIKLPSHDSIRLEGKIAWVRAKSAGIRFERVPTDAQVLLDAEVARVLAELASLEGAKTPS